MDENIGNLKGIIKGLLHENEVFDSKKYYYYVKEFSFIVDNEIMYCAKLIESRTGDCISWATSCVSSGSALYYLGQSACHYNININYIDFNGDIMKEKNDK